MKITGGKRRWGTRLIWVLTGLMVVLCCSPALAGTKTWNGGTNWWYPGYASLWTPSGIPAAGDDAILLNTTATDNIVLYYNPTTPTPVLNSLTIDATSTGNMTLNQGFGGALASVNEYVGYNGKGTHLQAVDTNTTNNLYLGYNSTIANGTYTLSDGFLNTLTQYLGYFNGATGTITQSGGTNTAASSLYLGYGQSSNGYYNLNNGSLFSNNEYVGYGLYSNATFSQNSGTNTTQNLTIGGSSGSSTYNLQGGNLYVNNTLNLNTGGSLNNGDSVLVVKTFNQNGGTVNGDLTNNPGSTYTYNSGAFNGRLISQSTATFNADFTASDGIDNQRRIAENNRNFTLNGFGLNNSGTFILNGGSIGGNGPVVNGGGTMSVNGDITGTNGFTNFGFFEVNSRVGLSKTGVNVNYGQIVFQPGYDQTTNQQTDPALVLYNSLINRGLINMTNYNMTNTTWIKGGTLTNDVGGIIQGNGIITSNFSNAGVVNVGGTMQIFKDFTNSGLIELSNYSNGPGILMGGATNGVPSGAINNTGTIQGGGTINNNIFNNGTINAGVSGGQLVLNGSVANNGTGLMTANDWGFLVTQGMAANAGKINIEGGGFDNNNHPMTNLATGQISGFGSFRTGGTGLLNYGKVNLTGGIAMITVVDGAVNNGDSTHTGARMDLSSYVYFSGLVTNYLGNTVKTYGVGIDLTKATLTFAGGFVNNGTYFSDPIVQFASNWQVTATGTMTGGTGDKWIIGGNFINNSTQNTTWNTVLADLAFSNPVSGTQHQLSVTGADLGNSRQGYQNNFAWGTLDITGQQISLVDGNDISGGALYTGLLLGAILNGNQVTNIFGANGLDIYYDPLLAGNAYLGGLTYTLQDGGHLAAAETPLPPTLWMVLSGLAGLGMLRRRKVNKS